MVAVICLAVGVIAGVFLKGADPRVAEMQAQIEAAKKLFPSISDMRAVSGKVTQVGSNSLTIQTDVVTSPFDDVPSVREIVVGPNTKLTKQISKDPKGFRAEMAAYEAKAANIKPGSVNAPLVPPSSFSEEEIKLSDIKVGDRITASADENIKTAAKFTALAVQVMPAAPAVLPPTAAPAPVPSPALPAP